MIKSTLEFLFKTKDAHVENRYIDQELSDSVLIEDVLGVEGVDTGLSVTLLWEGGNDLHLRLKDPLKEEFTGLKKSYKSLDASSREVKDTELKDGLYRVFVDNKKIKDLVKYGYSLKISLGDTTYFFDHTKPALKTKEVLRIFVRDGIARISFKDSALSVRNIAENDSTSVLKKKYANEIVSELESKGTRAYKGASLRDIALQEYPVEDKLSVIQNLQENMAEKLDSISDLIRNRIIDIRLKLEECESNVKQAMLSEKKLVGESFTMILPIDKDYMTENTTAVIEDGVILGSGYDTDKSVIKTIDLSTTNIVSENGTTFKMVGKAGVYPLTLSFSKNLYNPYQQVRFSAPSSSQSGVLVIKLSKLAALMVLDSDGYEIVPKHITSIVKFPISAGQKVFSLRFLDSAKTDVVVEAMYFTEAVYNKTTVMETHVINVGKDLSYLAVESCDNYASQDVDIKYEISLNGEDYEEYRPSGKLKDKLVPSLIKTDKFSYNEPIILENPERSEGVFKYYPENPIAQGSAVRLLSLKLGEDVMSLESYFEPENVTGLLMTDDGSYLAGQDGSYIFLEDGLSKTDAKLYIVVKKEFNLIVSEGSYIKLDDIKYNYEDTVGGAVLIRKGIRKLEVPKADWKETVDLNTYKVISIGEDHIEGLNLKTGLLERADFFFNPEEKQFNSVYLQLWSQGVDMYLKEVVSQRRYSENYIEYFYQDSPEKIYLYNESPSRLVDTIQIRATMTPVTETVCPYISKIIIRGI